ncbi:hypothetical protein RGUI_0801 [Rhodovulum sp. P5]|uniref:hypothetical protein n=2 Tax=root TaxID=1 RepID=UPI0009C344F8|nr:hypothetical protein [Rhodovulum sp. P5]ARE38258.1 hypothetical protein RGUI_0117 [Rhodovulum sp. P5]ARE38942.1 hypothetical protein RGUI_0801 [Rhodovulum sp. P5]
MATPPVLAAPPELQAELAAVQARVAASEMFLCRIEGDDYLFPYVFARHEDGTLGNIAPWEGETGWFGKGVAQLTGGDSMLVISERQYVEIRRGRLHTGTCEKVTDQVLDLLEVLYHTEPWTTRELTGQE